MSDLTPYERTWIQVLEELRTSPGIVVRNDIEEAIDESLGDAQAVAAEISENYGIDSLSDFRECYLRFGGIGSSWETADNYPDVSGEFYVRNLLGALEEPPPELGEIEVSGADPSLLSELRAIDGTPDTGEGSLAAIRILSGQAPPEIWFDHMLRGTWRMHIDYRDYLATLRVTKGTFGWQYLFTDVSLRGDEFRVIRRRLQNMLDVFPEMFPGDDYAPLRRRLSERLK
ncbi:hypothetical protein ACWEF9_23180 [Streptomyces sp. NPDC004980]